MRTQEISNEIKKQVIYRYQVLGYGQIKSGQPFGISDYIVKKILQEAKIPIRNFSQATTVSNKNRAISINHSYFDSENANMAYILGLLASDGTVRKDKNEIKLTLQAEDETFLNCIKTELGYEGTVKTYTTQQGYSHSTLTFTSERIKKKLAEYNIVPSKTYSFTFPAQLQRKYWLDFFRGYFDGDGTICQAGPALRFSLCSHTKNVLEVFLTFFEEEYGVKKVNIYTREDGLYYFQYSTTATKQIYSFLYPKNCLCLPRKYHKYTDLMNKFSTRL